MIPAQEKKEVREFDVERAKQYGRDLFGGAPDTIGQAYVLQAMRHQFELDKQVYDELLKERDAAIAERDELMRKGENLCVGLGNTIMELTQLKKDAQMLVEALQNACAYAEHFKYAGYGTGACDSWIEALKAWEGRVKDE